MLLRRVPIYRLSGCHRISMIFDRAFKAFRYPDDGRHLSELGDLTSHDCLLDIQRRMMADPQGQRILLEKPEINNHTFNLQELLKLEPTTFGHAYATFMAERGYSSEERPRPQYIHDPELAYVYLRYKQIHDFIHVLLMQDVTIHDELVVKWYEMAQLGLPSATLSATVGMLKLSPDEIRTLLSKLRSILKSAHQGVFIMNVQFEDEKNTDLATFRKRLGIVPV